MSQIPFTPSPSLLEHSLLEQSDQQPSFEQQITVKQWGDICLPMLQLILGLLLGAVCYSLYPFAPALILLIGSLTFLASLAGLYQLLKF